jgi:hypothetical protein
MLAFQPIQGASKGIAVGPTSASVEIGDQGTHIMVTNISDTPIFIRFGGSGVTASAVDDMVIPVNFSKAAIVIAKASGWTHVAAITATGSAKIVRFTPGFMG